LTHFGRPHETGRCLSVRWGSAAKTTAADRISKPVIVKDARQILQRAADRPVVRTRLWNDARMVDND
jgi:hypothetical protein